MFDTFGINSCRFDTDTDGAQERFNDVVALAALFCKLFTHIGQEDAPIAPLLNIAVCSQPLQHFRHRRLGYAKAQRYIDLSGLSPIFDKISNQFDIIFDQLSPAIVTGSPETLHMGAGVNKQTLGIAARAVIGIHMVFTSVNFFDAGLPKIALAIFSSYPTNFYTEEKF
ncbi:hypothetical protein BLM14_29825 (plasmid) [Phyllobacterium zundukense]|nr:hypothetical protein BLM14_29825 [Phyllobacterium zundukense]